MKQPLGRPPDATRPKAPLRWDPTTTMAASSSSASSASPRAGELDATVRYSGPASSASSLAASSALAAGPCTAAAASRLERLPSG